MIGFEKCHDYESSKVLVSMLLVQAFATGLQLLSKIILNDGTFIFALLAYRHVVGAVCVAPLALYFERGNATKLSLKVWSWLFINALTGVLSLPMGLYYYGLRDTTATYAANFLTVIPIATFVFSIILRVESLGLNTRAGKVKTIGAILCVAGALTTIFYQGKSFHINHQQSRSHAITKNIPSNWTRGTLMLLGSCLSFGVWFTVQVKLIKVFPLKYWSTMLTCIIASGQATTVGLCINRSRKSWSLGWNLQLITIVYSVRFFIRGAFVTATAFCLISWVIAKRGPTYPAMFNPLILIFVTVLEALLLREAIHLGTLVGTILILGGIYSFLSGKRKESIMNIQPPVNNVAPMDVEAMVTEATAIPPPKAMIVLLSDSLEQIDFTKQQRNVGNKEWP
ncbi:WAT1-related protein At5g64700-like [Rhodamnia argentea]|uniref:WAT1-related protein n=1 Tax=Rhodamnia argentea TaxID=178133 RepID=A0ABM3GTX2_9MYRT|nr:WAT1-related protein At5g64700-like [Rhodamnia argentea]